MSGRAKRAWRKSLGFRLEGGVHEHVQTSSMRDMLLQKIICLSKRWFLTAQIYELKNTWRFDKSGCPSMISSFLQEHPKQAPLSLGKHHMGGCQNYDPFWSTLHIRCRIVIGIRKGKIILTTTHISTLLTARRPREEVLQHLSVSGRQGHCQKSDMCGGACVGNGGRERERERERVSGRWWGGGGGKLSP